jgi:formylglycine-generating enzyme required for sulfatase activity
MEFDVPATRDGGHDPAPMVALVGGPFLMGTNRADGYPEDGEGPVREVVVAPFEIDATAVTNDAFGRFAAATGHLTDAERFGWSFVFAGFLPDDAPATSGVAAAPWWRQVYGADWRHPEGTASTVEDRLDHPATHVSWRDASAYARWAGKRLPSEAEWEYAARGGLVQQRFPWGDELQPGGEHRMNVWQGTFPTRNTMDDGYAGTAPVRSYPPNPFGLFEMTGNVWEWTTGWYDEGLGLRSMRGGSYLCHASYCNRYRVDARSGNTADSSTGNLGFRCVRSIEEVIR